eukprot:9602689-Karenia_brevis.AAC.1
MLVRKVPIRPENNNSKKLGIQGVEGEKVELPKDSGGSASSRDEPAVEEAGDQEMEEEETQKNEK